MSHLRIRNESTTASEPAASDGDWAQLQGIGYPSVVPAKQFLSDPNFGFLHREQVCIMSYKSMNDLPVVQCLDAVANRTPLHKPVVVTNHLSQKLAKCL